MLAMDMARYKKAHTSYGQLWTTCDELQESSASWAIEFGHDSEEEPDSTTLNIESMVSLDGLRKG